MRYEFECTVCGKSFEEFRSVEERDMVTHCDRFATRLISLGGGILIDQKLKDGKGNPIWFPKNNQSYFDKALQRTFHTKKQKCEYMKEKGYIMDGSRDKKEAIKIAKHDNRQC